MSPPRLLPLGSLMLHAKAFATFLKTNTVNAQAFSNLYSKFTATQWCIVRLEDCFLGLTGGPQKVMLLDVWKVDLCAIPDESHHGYSCGTKHGIENLQLGFCGPHLSLFNLSVRQFHEKRPPPPVVTFYAVHLLHDANWFAERAFII